MKSFQFHVWLDGNNGGGEELASGGRREDVSHGIRPEYVGFSPTSLHLSVKTTFAYMEILKREATETKRFDFNDMSNLGATGSLWIHL